MFEELFEKLKAIMAEFDAKVQEAVQPHVKAGSDAVVDAVEDFLKMVHLPLKSFMRSLDPDWTDEEKVKHLKDYGDGIKDPFTGKK